MTSLEAPAEFYSVVPKTLPSRPNLEEPLSFVVRTALMRCANELVEVQDLIDCAELLLAVGMNPSARLLYDVVFIQSGFSDFNILKQAKIAARTHLWVEPPPENMGRASTRRTAHPIEGAVAELAELFGLIGDARAPWRLRDEMIERSAALGESVNVLDPPGEGAPGPEFPALCTQLRRALATRGDAGSWHETNRLMEWVRRDILGKPRFDVTGHTGALVPELASGLAFNFLRRFMFANLDLAFGPHGSARLFHASARLDEAGLGPYFSQIGYLAGGGLDIVALLHLAARKIGLDVVDDDAIQIWAFLLSRPLRDLRLREFVEDLGDLGYLKAIWRILAAISRPTGVRPDRAFLWSTRDAGLDGGDLGLAMVAQRWITRWWSNDAIEWIILGDIEGTMGDQTAAERSFSRALDLQPANWEAEDHRDALRDGRFERFYVTRGYGSRRGRRRILEQKRGLQNDSVS